MQLTSFATFDREGGCEADRMIAAMARTGKQLMINWPLRWYPCHVTSKRLIDEGCIGEVLEVHYYDGNRGPLRPGADKVELEPGKKSESWFYQKEKGGGSLLDYLGYGATLGTWFLDGKIPIEVMSMVDEPTVRLQNRTYPEGRELPVDELEFGERNPIEYIVSCLECDGLVEGPLSPKISRIGQVIVDSALESLREKRTVKLPGV